MKLFRLAILGLACLGAVNAVDLHAQEGPRIFVFSEADVLRGSTAWNDALEKLTSMQTELEEALQAENDKLEAAQTEFEAQREIVAPDKLEDLQKSFSQQAIDFAVLQEKSRIELQRAERAARTRLNNAVGSIIESLAAERSAYVVLERSAVVFRSVDVDLTQEIVSRLNTSTKSIPVEMVELTEEQSDALRQRILQQIQQAQGG